jgi:hypothetical protein
MLDKDKIIPIILIAVSFMLMASTSYYYSRKASQNKELKQEVEELKEEQEEGKDKEESMMITLYLQDKEIAEKSDCGATHPISFEIPKTKDVADKSLRILFSDELAWYGNYISVLIENKIAKINVVPASQGGLSSCQAEHLMSVLSDTLTQYETIEKVELYDPTGNKIEF